MTAEQHTTSPAYGPGTEVHVEGAAVHLTARESEVIRLIGAGFSNKDIAFEQALSINSVKTYIRTAYRKLGLSSRTQAVRFWIEHEVAFSGGGEVLGPDSPGSSAHAAGDEQSSPSLPAPPLSRTAREIAAARWDSTPRARPRQVQELERDLVGSPWIERHVAASNDKALYELADAARQVSHRLGRPVRVEANYLPQGALVIRVGLTHHRPTGDA